MTEHETKLIRELLEKWFPAIRYADEEMNGVDTIDTLVQLYEYVEGVQRPGFLEDDR